MYSCGPQLSLSIKLPSFQHVIKEETLYKRLSPPSGLRKSDNLTVSGGHGGDVALCVCMMFHVNDLCLEFMPESLQSKCPVNYSHSWSFNPDPVKRNFTKHEESPGTFITRPNETLSLMD